MNKGRWDSSKLKIGILNFKIGGFKLTLDLKMIEEY